MTTGLATLGGLVKTAAQEARTDPTAAKATADEAEQQWQKIEGRIKKNDTGAYLEFEDGLSDVRTGASEKDADRAAKGRRRRGRRDHRLPGEVPGMSSTPDPAR